MTACPILGKMLADLRLKMCAPTATRTRDLLLIRKFETFRPERASRQGYQGLRRTLHGQL